jgi:hypothetical protein
MSKIEVDAIEPQSGTTLTIGASGDTIIVPAGTVSLPAITTTGDTNTGIFFPAADTIGFAEGGAEAMRIDSSGKVGIGTTTPDSRLEVLDSSATGIISRSTATQATDTNKALRVRNNSDTDTFAVSYKGSVFLGSGTGIYFDGSTSGSNKLDDYEEGTWTPSLVNAGTPTYTTQSGRYTKIGQIVICTFYLNYSSASPGGSTRIEGLPFASADDATTRQGFGSSTAATNRAVEGMWTTSSGTTRIQFIRAESASSLEMTGTVVLII